MDLTICWSAGVICTIFGVVVRLLGMQYAAGGGLFGWLFSLGLVQYFDFGGVVVACSCIKFGDGYFYLDHY
jgi:hypothetical protein